MLLGKVKWFNEIKGSGQIRSLEGGDFPVHFSEIMEEGFRTLSEGEVVEFEVATGTDGPRAVRVRRR
ncbi:MAG: cold shock domain-containing protein [Candidatus Eiseniibacteriota bacterium]|nr:MAG: cold shock domain-containing protein [Candidatus Eisenbacteria bacterium]